MLQVRENEISLRKWSNGTVQLRTLKGTLLMSVLLYEVMVTQKFVAAGPKWWV